MTHIQKTEGEWRALLGSDRFRVLRQKGTEAPFSGEFDAFYADGTYSCAGCGQVLFGSETKFDAGCGWPSFYEAEPGSVELRVDDRHGMVRTEVVCGTCGGHLGHVFQGEGYHTPTDKRYCVNSLSLTFEPQQ